MSTPHERSVALMKFLSALAVRLGVGDRAYVVGGAVRNFIIGQPIKDIDIVIEAVKSEQDSEWFAKEVQKALPVRSNLTLNQYGVAILTVKDSWRFGDIDLERGMVVEIANARRESYGGAEGKGYKPHLVEKATILEDLIRREFTFNTLLWRLQELKKGPEGAPVEDLLGVGLRHLADRELHTPADPDKTFSDDPTRMLRAVKFVARYGFKISPPVLESIVRNASKLKDMPWNAVQDILVRDILNGPTPNQSLRLMIRLGLTSVVRELLSEQPGFASGLGRALCEIRDIRFVLDIHEFAGWKIKSPVSFLSDEQRARLRVILHNAEAGAYGITDFYSDFFVHLEKPNLLQQRLFEMFSIPPKERGAVLQIARQALLDEPRLAQEPARLQAAVEDVLHARYSSSPAVSV